MKHIENDPNRIIKLPEVMLLTAKSRSSIYEAIRNSEFPASIPLSTSGRSVGWKYGEIVDWINSKAQVVAA